MDLRTYKNELRELNKELNTQKNLEQKYSFTEQINKKPSNFLNEKQRRRIYKF